MWDLILGIAAPGLAWLFVPFGILAVWAWVLFWECLAFVFDVILAFLPPDSEQ